MLAFISEQEVRPRSLPGRVRLWFVSVQIVTAFFLHYNY